MNKDNEMARRNFCQRVIYGLSSIMAAGLSIPALGYIFLPARKRQDDSWTEAGLITSLPEDTPKELVLQRKRTDGWKTVTQRTTAWVVKSGQDIVAFAPQCTHLGCGYRWDERSAKFLCPCHNSVFSMEGQVLSGPAPRPLDRYAIQIKGDRLWLGSVLRSDES